MRSRAFELRARERETVCLAYSSSKASAYIQQSDVVLGTSWQDGGQAFTELLRHLPLDGALGPSRQLAQANAKSFTGHFTTAQVGKAAMICSDGSSICIARPLPIDPFPVSRPPSPPRVFFACRTFAHAFSQKHTTLITRTSPPASLPRRDMSNPGQLSSR